jgi:hypothetical protein
MFGIDSGAHPSSYRMGIGALSPGAKLPWRETEHSPPPSAEIINGRTILLIPHTSACA